MSLEKFPRLNDVSSLTEYSDKSLRTMMFTPLDNKCFRTRDIVFGKAFKDHLGILKKEPHSPSGQWERLKMIPRLWRSISNVNPRKNQTLPKTLHFFSSHPSSHAVFIFFFSTTNPYPKSAEGRNNKPECGGPRRLCRRATHQTSYPRA